MKDFDCWVEEASDFYNGQGTTDDVLDCLVGALQALVAERRREAEDDAITTINGIPLTAGGLNNVRKGHRSYVDGPQPRSISHWGMFA